MEPRVVERGQARKKRKRVIPHLGVDEKAIARRHQYVTMVCDLDRGTVEFLAENREKTSLDAYYASLLEETIGGHPGRGDGQYVGAVQVSSRRWLTFLAAKRRSSSTASTS